MSILEELVKEAVSKIDPEGLRQFVVRDLGDYIAQQFQGEGEWSIEDIFQQELARRIAVVLKEEEFSSALDELARRIVRERFKEQGLYEGSDNQEG